MPRSQWRRGVAARDQQGRLQRRGNQDGARGALPRTRRNYFQDADEGAEQDEYDELDEESPLENIGPGMEQVFLEQVVLEQVLVAPIPVSSFRNFTD